MAYLGKRLREKECRIAADANYLALRQKGIAVDAERCDLFYLTRLFLRCPEVLVVPDEKHESKDCFLPNLGVLVAHGTDVHGHHWDFAAKAGHNEEHHNHNDCGSYLLNIGGHRFIAEIGAPEYVRKFFGPKRYEFLAARSLGHSLPVINGYEQFSGRKAESRIIGKKISYNEITLRIDATRCYPEAADCRSFIRSFCFEKQRGQLTVRDAISLGKKGQIESAVITIHPVSLSRGRAEIRIGALRLILQPLPGTQLGQMQTHSYRDHEGHDAHIYRLILCGRGTGKKYSIGFTAHLD